MIESKADKQAFASMKEKNEEITLALEYMTNENARLKS
jgi:hypothetical protein